MNNIMEGKKLMWFGHLIRMGDDRQVKNVWKARRSGKDRI